MVMMYVESDFDCWSKYASQRHLDEGVRQFLNGNSSMLSRQGNQMNIPIEPTERAWEMVSILRKQCHFKGELATEVYAGIVGEEAAFMFMRWLSDHENRPLTGNEILNSFEYIKGRAAAQRDDMQAATIHDLVVTVSLISDMEKHQEENLVAYSAILPRDLRFSLIKSLLKIPAVALKLSQDKYDAVIFDAIHAINTDAY